MQTNFDNIYCILVVLLFSSCNVNKDKRDSLIMVDIESNVKKMELINLSQFTDNVKYFPLENKENLFLRFIDEFDISGNMILTTDMNVCLLYDTSGHFISKFGKKGRGPEEYESVGNLSFGKNKKIYLKSMYDLFEYNLDGSFVKKYSKTFLINDKYYIYTCFPFGDSLFFGHVPNSTGQIEYKAFIVDKHGSVKHSYKNYILFNRERPASSGFEGQANIYQFKNELFYKDYYNDTLFFLNSKLELIPKYAFNLGKFKEPVSDRAKPMMQKFTSNKMMNFLFLQSVFQTEKYLFLSCAFGNHFPAKRLTPKEYPLPGVKPTWYNTTNALGIYNKQTNELAFCKPTSTDNPLFTSGIYNDIDAGPRFFPDKMINDSAMVMFIRVKDLKDHVASKDFTNNVPKFPEKKKELEELANSLSEFDNPLVMFVTFKK